MKFAAIPAFKYLFLISFAIPAWLTYTDSENKFSMNYPQEWAQKKVGNVTAFLSPQEDAADAFQENVNLMLQDLSQQPMDLKQYTELSKKQIIEAYGASAILSAGSTTLGGKPAMQQVYNMTYQGRPLKIKQYWFIKGKTAYLFSYTAEPAEFPKFEETATAVINSFKFL